MKSTGRAVPRFLPDELDRLQPLLSRIAGLIKYDAIVVGVGHRNDSGEVALDRCHFEGFSEKFILDYAKVAKMDSAAQLFVSNATSVLSISTLDDYTFDDKLDATKVADYLRRHNVGQLLLSGIDSSMGLMWVTLYRRDARVSHLLSFRSNDEIQTRKKRDDVQSWFPKGFTLQECEIASYVIRAGLYDWQLSMAMPPVKAYDATRYKMIPLSPAELDVAVRLARGQPIKVIHEELHITRSAVNLHIAAIKDKGIAVERIAERLLGPLPPARTSNKQIKKKAVGA